MTKHKNLWTRHRKDDTHLTDMVRDALDIEDACYAVNKINRRKRIHRDDEKDRRRLEKAKKRITLPTLETLRKLLED